jgi:hypothetical protein
MIELPISRLRPDAVLPERAYAGDAGLDLSACEQHELGPGDSISFDSAQPHRLATVGACMVERLRRVSFPVPEHGTSVRVTQSFNVHPPDPRRRTDVVRGPRPRE